MSEFIVVENESFSIMDCGGGGACLFQCLARSVDSDHRTVRRKIVSHVIEKWDKYQPLVYNIFNIKKKDVYRQYMGDVKSYASEIEVCAAKDVYSRTIVMVRKLDDNRFYPCTYGFTSENVEPIYLLFTGDLVQGATDGHFQLLKKCNNIDHFIINDDSLSDNVFSEILNNSQDEESRVLNEIQNNPTSAQRENAKRLKSNSQVNPRPKKQNFNKNQKNKSKRIFFSKSFKEIIIRVKNFFEKNKENCPGNVYETTAECLNISVRSVFRVCREHKITNGKINGPGFDKNGKKRIVLDDFYKPLIRNHIYDMYMEKQFPTVKKLHQRLKDSIEDFPDIKDHVLRRTMEEMNFKYKKIDKKPILMESSTIVGKRAEYLQKIQYYRSHDWNIYYTDETWCGANHSKQYGWVEKIDENSIGLDNYDHYRSGVQNINGFRGGFLTPSGAGKRIIILHIGSKDGFLAGGDKCFIGQKGSADYHKEMNAQHYVEWFREILVKLPRKSVFVLDQAPYHTMIHPDYRNPTTKWRKAELIEWMKNRSVPLPVEVDSFEQLNKDYLLMLSRPHHHPKVYLLEEIAREMRGDEIKLLWLPVAHCEFNPIELIWAYIKNQVAKKNTTFKVNDVLELCKESMNNVPDTLWENCVKHARKYEEKYRSSASRIAESIEPIIINTAESSSEESDDCETTDTEND